jgi:hypothetical protein
MPTDNIRRTTPRVMPRLTLLPERPSREALPPVPPALPHPGLFIAPEPLPLPARPPRNPLPVIPVPPKPRIVFPERPAEQPAVVWPEFAPTALAQPAFEGIPPARMPVEPSDDSPMPPFDISSPHAPIRGVPALEKLSGTAESGALSELEAALAAIRAAEPHAPVLGEIPPPPQLPGFVTPVITASGRWPPTNGKSSLGESSLGDAKSSLGDAESSLGGAKISLGDAESSLGDAKSSLGDAESSLGDVKSSLGESSLGDAKSSLGDAESSLGDAESSLGDAG